MKQIQFWNILSSGIMLMGALLFGYQIWKYETFTFLAAVGALIFMVGIIVRFLYKGIIINHNKNRANLH